jgi:hypothetical protein
VPDPKLTRPAWIDRVSRLGFIELFEKYRKRMVHDRTMLPFDPSSQAASPYTFEALAFETGWGLRLALKLFMPLCGLLFVSSYVVAWTWEADFVPAISRVLRSCAVAGSIGFGTNWVAIKMLFWPREPRPVFGQGLIPSQRDQLIQKVADEVLEKLINAELIERKVVETRIAKRFSDALIEKLQIVVNDEEFKEDLKRAALTMVGDLVANDEFRRSLMSRAEQRFEEFAGSGMRSWMVKKLKDVWRAPLADFVDNELQNLDVTLTEGIEHLDGAVAALPLAIDKRQEAIDHVLTTMLMGLVHEVDVREIVLEQLSTVTSEQLETGFRAFSDDKLSFITLLGGVLGIVGGTVLVWPLYSVVVLIALGVVLVLIDVFAAPLMREAFWPKKKRGAPEE